MNYTNKSEKQDASIIQMIGMSFAILNLTLVVYFESYLKVIFIIIILLATICIYNYSDVYINMSDKYKCGNSYVKRKFSTVGLFLTFIYMLIILICYILGFTSTKLAAIILIIAIITPIEKILINKLWKTFDENKYYETDKLNPSQKKYWNEPKSIYSQRDVW